MDSFKICINDIFVSFKKWLKDNELKLNIDRKYIMNIGTTVKLALI
jgi:hypothetical protein